MSNGEQQVVLLHGVTMSAAAWQGVIPLLDDFEVHAPTAAGHRGGPAARHRPATIADTVDATERFLDEQGLDRPHLVGNSMGGWVAIELARRGRAASVCALAPAGFWALGHRSHTAATARVRRTVTMSRIPRPLTSMALRSGLARRLSFRDIACRADRITHKQALESIDDVLGCAVAADLLGTPEFIAPLDPLPCPVTLAWSEHDKVFPVDVNGAIARERLPAAEFVVLPGVGHVPMIDDPRLVAETIRRRVTGS
jgi:pimeloyl-ACP methyl ester carboxylesterase